MLQDIELDAADCRFAALRVQPIGASFIYVYNDDMVIAYGQHMRLAVAITHHVDTHLLMTLVILLLIAGGTIMMSSQPNHLLLL